MEKVNDKNNAIKKDIKMKIYIMILFLVLVYFIIQGIVLIKKGIDVKMLENNSNSELVVGTVIDYKITIDKKINEMSRTYYHAIYEFDYKNEIHTYVDSFGSTKSSIIDIGEKVELIIFNEDIDTIRVNIKSAEFATYYSGFILIGLIVGGVLIFISNKNIVTGIGLIIMGFSFVSAGIMFSQQEIIPLIAFGLFGGIMCIIGFFNCVNN